MRAHISFAASCFLCLAAYGGGPDDDRVVGALKGTDYTVELRSPRDFPADSQLEIGFGSGHGFSMNWVQFRPGDKGVDVRLLQFDENIKPYHSKWPPDSPKVVIQTAVFKSEVYAALLRQIAAADAAELKPLDRDKTSWRTSSNDFWVQARLKARDKTLFDADWAGYEGDAGEPHYAKARAEVRFAREAIKDLKFEDRPPTDDDRAWVSDKFIRDWANIKDREFYWWVRERYIMAVGLAGDQSALPTLRPLLDGDPKSRDVYYAINAVTRLTGKDVRDHPVEQMDVDSTRRRLIEVLDARK